MAGNGAAIHCRAAEPVHVVDADGQHLHPNRSGRKHQGRQRQSTEKIDSAVATIMALDRAIRCSNDTNASVYDSRSILFI